MNISFVEYSWNVAIKTIRRRDEDLKCQWKGKTQEQFNNYSDDELPLLLDEAKTMWSVGDYHENIVNLQGLTAKEECGILYRVCKKFYTKYVC